MLPVVYEFHADPAHIVFSAFFLLAVTTVILFAARAGWLARQQVQHGKAGAARWHEDFEALPADRRNCRFDPNGSRGLGVCERGFHCADCPRHAHLASTLQPPECAIYVYGLPVHADRGYHRGHTWARPDEDGTILVGLDPLARRAFPREDSVSPAPAGRNLSRGDAVFEDAEAGVRVLTPVTGRVLDAAGNGSDTIVRIRPTNYAPEELLHGPEAAGWMDAELRWLTERAVADPAGHSLLADGGEVVVCLPEALPFADWPTLREELFLDV